MTNSTLFEDSPRPPFWLRRERLIQIIVTTVALVAALTGVTVGLIEVGVTAGGIIPPPLAALGLLVGIRAPQRWRWLSIVVLAIAPLSAALLGAEPLVTWTITVFAAFVLSLRGVYAAVLGAVVASADLLAVGFFENDFLHPTAFVSFSLVVAATAAGAGMRARRQAYVAGTQRAVEARSARESATNRRVAEERLRIARDLHDVVGHEVAVLSMHLGMAEVALPAEGSDQTRAALHSARAGVQSILHETQRILDVLRFGADEGAMQPAPEIAHIEGLVESFRSIGLDVRASLADVGTVDPAVSAAVYRIAQESLTNAQRHGEGPVDLAVTADATQIVLTSGNRIAGTPSGEGRGYGLVGIRERVQSAGGRVTIDTSDGWFRLTATLRRDGRDLT